MVSDDTDHSVFVVQSLALSPASPERFASSLAWRLRFWLICCPAGIGWATLRSIIRLWFGISPARSGAFSAGNGAAMRSAVIGVVHQNNRELRQSFVRASTRITHTDPQAEFGAQAIAEVAAWIARENCRPPLPDLERMLRESGEGAAWNDAVQRTLAACRSGNVEESIPAEWRDRGVSGYIGHTMPAVVSAWFIHFGNFRKTIETVVSLGGDTDTVSAIAGSLAGLSVTRLGIPEDWVSQLVDYPHGPRYFAQLADAIAEGPRERTAFSWWLFPRGLVFTAIVLGHGFRRLLLPF
jgi:ADP-ribosylglycohydrolase